MKLKSVVGMPLEKLKESFVVLIFDSLADFHSTAVEGSEDVLYDKQKAYILRGKRCYVIFHNGSKDFFDWVMAHAGRKPAPE